jgi:hypothetical protein
MIGVTIPGLGNSLYSKQKKLLTAYYILKKEAGKGNDGKGAHMKGRVLCPPNGRKSGKCGKGWKASSVQNIPII